MIILAHKWLPILLNAFDGVLLYYRTVKRLLIPVLQIRVHNGKLVLLFLNQNICRGYLNGPLKWDGSFENQIHTFLTYDKGNITISMLRKVAQLGRCGLQKMHFSAKWNSGHIAIQWIHIKRYLGYQYTKFQLYTFRVQKNCVFARYATLVSQLSVSRPNKNICVVQVTPYWVDAFHGILYMRFSVCINVKTVVQTWLKDTYENIIQ